MIAHILLAALPFFLTPKYNTDYVPPVNAIIANNAKLMKSEQLYLIGQGGAMMDQIEWVFLHYASDKNPDLETARKIYVKAIENLRAQINVNKKIRPFLNEYPFPQERIRVIIGFNNRNLYAGGDQDVAMISAVGNEVIYSAQYPKSKQYHDIHSESYADALRLANSSR